MEKNFFYQMPLIYQHPFTVLRAHIRELVKISRILQSAALSQKSFKVVDSRLQSNLILSSAKGFLSFLASKDIEILNTDESAIQCS